MKNKFRILLLCALCAVLLFACDGNTTASESQAETSAAGISENRETSTESVREAIMSYEIPDQFSDKYTDAFGITDLKSMRLECKADVYNIYYDEPDGGCYMTQLVRKRWGVWMLGALEYTGADGVKVQLMGASTDYEWVLSCGSTASSITFRGGNHGDYALGNADWDAEDSSQSNDRLLDITFYDAATGDRLSPEEGETLTVTGLRVVIHTNIYEGEYTQENVLLNAEKLYLFNGGDIFLQSKLYVTRNTYFKTSYTCMLPIYKKYGNYMMFYNDDGSTKLVKTPVVGTSNYGSNFSDYNVASEVEVWGEQAPAYHITMKIYNPQDQFLQSERYTRLWDMNPSSNKLYFSAFSQTPTLIKKGTEWEYLSSWSFSYRPDFISPQTADEWIGFPET